MGPNVVTMALGPVTWAVLAISLIIGAVLAYEIAVAEQKAIRWPHWPGRTLRFIYRWYPRVVVPLLIALSWLWL